MLTGFAAAAGGVPASETLEELKTNNATAFNVQILIKVRILTWWCARDKGKMAFCVTAGESPIGDRDSKLPRALRQLRERSLTPQDRTRMLCRNEFDKIICIKVMDNAF